jgi:hypothetical protein
MSDEEKKESKVCNCGELGRFFTQVAAIFLGVLLAILVSAALLKPKCPCKGPMPFPPRPMYERQVPPMHGQWNAKRPGEFQIKNQKFDRNQTRRHHDFQPTARPDKAPAQK